MVRKKVVVLHHLLSRGGEGVVFCSIVYSLVNSGFDVHIAASNVNIDLCEEILNMKIHRKNIKITNLFYRDLNILGLYQRILSALSLAKLNSYDILINAHGEPIPPNLIKKSKYIMYMHFPTVKVLEYNPTLSYTRMLMRIYFEIYRIVATSMMKENIERASLIIVNSRFTQMVLRKVAKEMNINDIDSRVRIIKPPVPRYNELISCRATPFEGREDIVVTIGRFSPEKNYELILDIAKELRDVKFIIIGSVGKSKARDVYFNKLRKVAPRNVLLLRDLSEEEKINMLRRAKVYLHTMPGEHFGISIAEAAIAGLTLVIPKYSGAWLDICQGDRYCYSYSIRDAEHSKLAELLEIALRNNKRVPVDIVREFDLNVFMNKIVADIEEIYQRKETT